MSKRNRKQIFKRIVEISFKHPLWMGAAVVLAVISAIFYFVPYVIIFKILKLVLNEFPAASNINTGELIRLGVIAFIGIAINVITYFAALICSHIAAFHTAFEIKKDFAKHLLHLPLGYHLFFGSGKLRGVMDSSVGQIQSFMSHKIPDMVASLIYPVSMVGIMLWIDFRFGIAASIGVIIAYVFHAMSMGKGGSKHEMDLYLDALSEMDSASVEYVRGITVIKNNAFSFKKLYKSIDDYTNMVIPYTRKWEKYMCWFVVLINSVYLFVAAAGMIFSKSAANYREFAAVFIFYLILSPSIASVIQKIGGIMRDCMLVNEHIERMDNVLFSKELKEPKTSWEPQGSEVCFENVSFSYEEGGNLKALSNVSFTVKPNTLTALVGPSGSGKSTIAHLIARFWDVDDGSIKIGGVDVKDINFSSLMEKVSFVFQDDYLFKQTVKENIAMAKKDATLDMVISAAKAANCHDFIVSLPKGYETVIGEDGVHLSGGEKQRIVLARTILKDAPIIVLDEATSFQDMENQYLIQKAMDNLLKNKTVIMVAHRLLAVKNADQILVMKDGSIAEAGNHNELMDKKGDYFKMWQSYEKVLSWRF